MFALLLPAALAGPPVPELAAKLDQFNAHAEYPLPRLSARQLTDLANGEVVRILERPAGGDVRAIGLLVVEWRMTSGPDSGKATWYGHIDLPSPFKDRHWVVSVWNNHALHRATNGVAWEHP